MSKQLVQKGDTSVQWTKEQLYSHLQMAIEVEYYTIPLYLTAAYSIKPEHIKDLVVTVEGEDQYGQPIMETFPVYDTVFSVAIQEMYHLMWICNVAKSVGMDIKIPAPDMTKLPSTLNLPTSITSKYKGVGNLADVIDLLVAIETPDPSYSYPVDPDDPITKFAGPINPQDSYNSIGDLYHALSYGLTELFPSLHDSKYDQYQKIMLADSYPKVPKATDLNSALDVIGAIVEQGEGTGVEGYIPTDYEPQAGGYEDEDKYTHYERFVAIQKDIERISEALYPTPPAGKPDDPLQSALTQAYSQLLDGINSSYTLAGEILNTPGMTQVATALTDLWKGGELPLWIYAPQPMPVPLELHVCQGLNSCSGHGANRSGTMPGDGDCATISHICQSSNDCRGQGGCGYPGQATSGGDKNVFTPGENSCKGLGGCAAPISVWQVFSDKGGPLDGKYVWCEARKLFEARMNSLNMKFGQPNQKPTDARLAPSTSSGTKPLPDNNSCPN